jgi:alkylated DNA repair protein (DNA oxidative demethylase)
VSPVRGVREQPEGLRYLPDVLTDDEEQGLLEGLRDLDYREVRLHGQAARRTVRHYGVDYAFESRSVAPGEPVPEFLEPVRARCAGLLERPPEALAEVLVTHYPPGAAIGWHRDAPPFGDVVGVSLGAPCVLRFQRGKGSERRVHEQPLEPRSVYVLGGPARSTWQHSIPAVAQTRYSLTFRTLRRPLR